MKKRDDKVNPKNREEIKRNGKIGWTPMGEEAKNGKV